MSDSSKSDREKAYLEEQLMRLLSEWRLCETELQNVASESSQLQSRLDELQLVADEMTHLEADAALFKMVGPLLQPMTVSDGTRQVDARLKYLTEEQGRFKLRLQHLGTQQRERRSKLNALQQKLPHIPPSIFSV